MQPGVLGRQQGVAIAVTVAALAVAACAAVRAAQASVTQKRRAASSWSFLYEVKQYVAHRGTPSTIDGDVFKQAWQRVPWSEPFVEIRGETDAPPGTSPTEAQRTRMKMMWDDEYLYVAAVLDFPAGDELVAKFTERNTPIFHTDSDFEVFIDPSGCCQGYKELELNAINTVWNLMLTKPYSNGGKELSGRVNKPGHPEHWDVKAQRTAARVTKGSLHDPSRPAQWVCELAFAHKETLDVSDCAKFLSEAPVRGPAPRAGESWRINFSRVEKKGEVNWVWSPQVVWSPSDQRYVGQVNMHLPDAWGLVLFADEQGKLPGGASGSQWRDPSWAAKHTASAVYYAVREFEAKHKRPAASYEEVEAAGLVVGAFSEGAAISLSPGSGNQWTVTVRAGGWVATITGQHLLKVRRE